MARIQILEISPTETPMEELSYDQAGNITGGFNAEDLSIFIQQIFDFADDTIKEAIGLIKDIFN